METHGDPPELPTITDSINPQTPSPNPADPAIVHTKDSTVPPGELSLAQQVEHQEIHLEGRASPAIDADPEQHIEAPRAKQESDLQGNQQDGASQIHPDDDSALQILTEDNDGAVGDNDDTFSDYESAHRSSFYTSILSKATDYYWENGRRYHAHQGGRYVLPNDEVELDREDMKHHEWMLVTDFRLHLSPIGEYPQRILDIGTGTGIWAMQIAELYPSAEVIGTDISPVQPEWVPPNLTFEVDDLEEEWLFRPGTYDLVHVRFMFLAIKDYPAMLAQAYRQASTPIIEPPLTPSRTLKPGGYVELSELATTPEATNPNCSVPVVIFRWLDLVNEAMEKRGFTRRVAPTFKDLLTNAGFVDVVETKFEVPWGPWPEDRRKKAIGLWHLEQLKQGLQGIVMGLFTRDLGWTPTEVELFLMDLRRELNDKSYHLLDHAYVVYGRKPFAASGAN